MGSRFILIGTPTSVQKSYCLEAWVRVVKSIEAKDSSVRIVLIDTGRSGTYAKRIRELGIECLRIKPFAESVQGLCIARQQLYDIVVHEGFDFFLSLEQDVFPPQDILERLLSHDKLVVGVPYPMRTYTNPATRRAIDIVTSAHDLARPIIGSKPRRFTSYLESELRGMGLVEVQACGLGCTLINVEILKMVSTRCAAEVGLLDDALFFEDIKELGIKCYVDAKYVGRVKHYPEIRISYGLESNPLADME